MTVYALTMRPLTSATKYSVILSAHRTMLESTQTEERLGKIEERLEQMVPALPCHPVQQIVLSRGLSAVSQHRGPNSIACHVLSPVRRRLKLPLSRP